MFYYLIIVYIYNHVFQLYNHMFQDMMLLVESL